MNASQGGRLLGELPEMAGCCITHEWNVRELESLTPTFHLFNYCSSYYYTYLYSLQVTNSICSILIIFCQIEINVWPNLPDDKSIIIFQ